MPLFKITQAAMRSCQFTPQAKAKADLERIRPLAEMKAVSEQELAGAVAQEAAAAARVTSAPSVP